jgi:Uma2 family endonuclease
MSVALQDPMIGPHTIEEWLALPPTADGSRIELINGHFHVTPAPAGEHQLAALNLVWPLRTAFRAAQRTDLHVNTAVNVKISSALRTALIPDLVVLDRKPIGVSFPAEALVLVLEVWSPGNSRAERDAKMAAYASAGVPFVWTIEQKGRLWLKLTAYRFQDGLYVVENTVQTEGPVTITAAPVPVTVDLGTLMDS